MESEDMVFKTQGVTWRNNRVIPLGDGQGEDIVYLTKNRRAGVLKSASMRNWRWYVEKYSIVWWTYLSDLIFF